MRFNVLQEMDSSLIWALIALAGGIFLIFCGISTLFWWRKRARREQCVGVIKEIKIGRDGDGFLTHHPIITGSHRSEDFQFTGQASELELEIGSQVQVSYDPKTGRYFDYHPLNLWLSIVGSIAGGICLHVIAWILYSGK